MHGSVSYARAENYCELRVASLLIATLKRKTAAGAIAPTSSRKVRGDESTSTSPPGPPTMHTKNPTIQPASGNAALPGVVTVRAAITNTRFAVAATRMLMGNAVVPR